MARWRQPSLSVTAVHTSVKGMGWAFILPYRAKTQTSYRLVSITLSVSPTTLAHIHAPPSCKVWDGLPFLAVFGEKPHPPLLHHRGLTDFSLSSRLQTRGSPSSPGPPLAR